VNRKKHAFTLVEILIVVIILGILAAIVVPQFTNAGTDARESATKATLQMIRGQIELFKVQHGEKPPNLGNNGQGYWKIMTGKSNTNEVGPSPGNANGKFGPYLHTPPVNPFNGLTVVGNLNGGNQSGNGWAYDQNTGKIQAVNRNGSGLLSY